MGLHDFPHVSESLGPRNSVGGSFLSRSIALRDFNPAYVRFGKSGHQPPGSPYGLYYVDRGDRRRSQELQDGDRPLLLGLLPESIPGACHSYLHGFWLVQADREQYSRTIGPVVPSIEAGKACSLKKIPDTCSEIPCSVP